MCGGGRGQNIFTVTSPVGVTIPLKRVKNKLSSKRNTINKMINCSVSMLYLPVINYYLIDFHICYYSSFTIINTTKITHYCTNTVVIRRSRFRCSGPAPLWNLFYGHSFPSAPSRRTVISYWFKTLVNRSESPSLPRKCVVGLSDRPNMTITVCRGRLTTQQHLRAPASTTTTSSSTATRRIMIIKD